MKKQQNNRARARGTGRVISQATKQGAQSRALGIAAFIKGHKLSACALAVTLGALARALYRARIERKRECRREWAASVRILLLSERLAARFAVKRAQMGLRVPDASELEEVAAMYRRQMVVVWARWRVCPRAVWITKDGARVINTSGMFQKPWRKAKGKPAVRLSMAGCRLSVGARGGYVLAVQRGTGAARAWMARPCGLMGDGAEELRAEVVEAATPGDESDARRRKAVAGMERARLLMYGGQVERRGSAAAERDALEEGRDNLAVFHALTSREWRGSIATDSALLAVAFAVRRGQGLAVLAAYEGGKYISDDGAANDGWRKAVSRLSARVESGGRMRDGFREVGGVWVDEGEAARVEAAQTLATVLSVLGVDRGAWVTVKAERARVGQAARAAALGTVEGIRAEVARLRSRRATAALPVLCKVAAPAIQRDASGAVVRRARVVVVNGGTVRAARALLPSGAAARLTGEAARLVAGKADAPAAAARKLAMHGDASALLLPASGARYFAPVVGAVVGGRLRAVVRPSADCATCRFACGLIDRARVFAV